MINTKLVKVLLTFNQEELRGFKRFLSSKIFNQHKMASRLFDIIRKQLMLKNPNLAKEFIYSQLHPNSSLNVSRLTTYTYYLFKVVERYLAFQEIYNNPHNEKIALCKAYRKKNMETLFLSSLNSSKQALAKSPFNDAEFHQLQHQLEEEKYNSIVEKKRATATNLQQVLNSLDVSYFAQRLKQSCEILAHKSVYNEDYDLGMIDEVIKEIERQQLLKIPAISLYYYVYLAQTKADNTFYFKELKHQLTNHYSLFDQQEIRSIFILAINIGIRYLNQGKTEVMQELLELYKNGVEQKLLLSNNILSRFTYKNMIALGVRLEQFEWVEQFLHQYKDSLEPAYKEESFQYNKARLFYGKKAYEDAIPILALSSASDDVYINLDAKLLLAIIYYEISNLDALETLLNNFKTFIRRKNMIGYQRLNYQNFIACLNKLVYTNLYDKSDANKLLEEIQNIQPLPNKYWFINQLTSGT